VQIEQAFSACIDEIAQRVEKLKTIAMRQLGKDEIKQALQDLQTGNFIRQRPSGF
jgi:hypothetical protein